MKKYLYIGGGSFVGAVLRYLLKGISMPELSKSIPLMTLFINLSGAFLLAFLLSAAYETGTFHSDIRLGLTAGTLGAYTTFSSLCKELSFHLMEANYLPAFSYMFLSVSLGLCASLLGIAAARQFGVAFLLKKQQTEMILETGNEEWD